MDNLYSSFYLYRKYEVIGDELIDLGITSVDADGTQEPVMKEECDPACGCVTYRWVQTEDTVCIEVQYRWTESGTTCIGYDKYQNNIKEESIDGVNWSVVIPEEYSASTLIQRNSEDCGYIPPFEGGYRLFLDNGTRVTGDCCPETACSLDWHDISMNYSGSVVSAEIGGCIDFLNNAFAWCTKLSAVTLYEGITELRGYLTGNYDGVFYKCTSLSSVTLPDSLEIIGEGSFYRSGLQDVTFGTGVTTIGDLAFGECTGLTSMTIPDGVTSIGQQAFDACYGLTSITIPNSVTSLGSGAFRNCTGLTNVNISTGVTYINDSTFQNCKSLTAITIPNSVTGIGGWSFSGCAFTSLDIPNNITSIGFQAFRRCRSLTAVTIGTGITRINEEAFTECNRLQSITINATTPPTLGDHPFYDTNNCPIYVPCESVSAYQAAEGWSDYASRIEGIPPCGQPTPTIDGKFKLTLNDSSTVTAECDSTSALTRNEISAYSASVTSAVIGNCVTELQGGYSHGVFEECKSLTSVTIPSSVTTIGGYVFNHCHGLTSVTIPNSVTSIDSQAFSYCYNLRSAIIGSGATSIIRDVFLRCTNLTTITIDSNNSTYDSRDNCNAIIETNSNKLIQGCKGSHIPAGVVSIGFGAFSQCSGLTSVDIPDSVTSIDQDAFGNCTSLTSVTIGNGLTSIGVGAFYRCSGLTTVDIPNSVTSIGQNAFQDCNALTGITIPSGVTSIGIYTFKNCTSLGYITINATTPPTLSAYDPFANTNNCPIYVPAASVNAYKTASRWSTYASRIQAIP